jgi:hypothetical protein
LTHLLAWANSDEGARQGEQLKWTAKEEGDGEKDDLKMKGQNVMNLKLTKGGRGKGEIA